MKKILVISTLIISMCIQLDAQNAGFLFGRPTRKQLQKENADLKTALDSLQVLLDSFEHRRYLEDSELIAVMEGNSEAEADDTVYTAEMRDSLLQLWYKNSTIVNYDALHEYDMDSVKFSSNVSDEEMVRRLEAMNSFISLPFNENVKNYIILYSEKMPSRMGRVLGLSNYYFPIFEDILNRYDLPEELKYMAVVESMLNPTATSHAGAKGIWQFIYSTAKSYGLEINSYVDERMDVEKSMDAAANAENKDGKQMTVFDKISTGKNEEEMITNRMVVNQLINELQDRDKEIILLRFFKEKTQTEVAKILGISQVQVSRIERKVLNEMK